MIVVPARNVNDAFVRTMRTITSLGQRRDSRDGPTLTLPVPLTTHYRRPQERVLFMQLRDANPFFHLFESMWMLMGRSDARWLDTYIRDFSERYAEPDGEMHGAYGRRWRSWFGADQLVQAVSVLRESRNSRQAVVQMWDPAADLGATVRDRPCNVSISLRIRDRRLLSTDERTQVVAGLDQPCLDMTVFCRSNDAIMGAYGANAVHMSVLQEWLAAKIGVEIGHYWQVSCDMHVYLRDMERYTGVNWHDSDLHRDPYEREPDDIRPIPLFESGPQALECLEDELWEWSEDTTAEGIYRNNILIEGILRPMATAHHCWRDKNREGALEACDAIVAPDWRRACREWIVRRKRVG